MVEDGQTLAKAARMIKSAEDAIIVAQAGEALSAEAREFQPEDYEQEKILWGLRASVRGLVRTAWAVAVRMGGVRA
jgi:hypothetical protein